MPITKLQRHTALKRRAAITRKARTKEKGVQKHLQTTHYKKFCDICFEFYIRERDGWVDTLDGRKFQYGDFQHYHACHFIPRQALFTRYDPMNCHGQSSGHNWAASPKASPVVRYRFMLSYRAWLVRKYGKQAVKELEERGKQIGQFTIPMWMDCAKEQYERAKSVNEYGIKQRLASVFSTGYEQGILEQILAQITQGEK